MGIKYRLIAKKDMTKGAAADDKLFYPQLVMNGRVSFEALCQEASEQSSLTSGDIKNCMDRIVYCAVAHLKEGRSVDLGDLGGLRLALRSGGTATEADYDVEVQMRNPKVVFSPGKKLREMKSSALAYERQTEPEPDTETPDDGGEDDGPVVQ